MFKVEVIADSSGKWCGNQLTFATIDLARSYAIDLMWRWTAVRNWHVIDPDGNEVANDGTSV